MMGFVLPSIGGLGDSEILLGIFQYLCVHRRVMREVDSGVSSSLTDLSFLLFGTKL